MCAEIGSPVLLACSSTSRHATGDLDVIARDLRKLAMLGIPLGVKIALHIDEQGPRPAWIQMQDGRKVTPDQGDAWAVSRLIASASMQNYVGMIRHVLNLHYVAAQHGDLALRIEDADIEIGRAHV